MAYVCPIVETIALYAEVLPGFSLIMPSQGGDVARGFVIGFGLGAIMDLTEQDLH